MVFLDANTLSLSGPACDIALGHVIPAIQQQPASAQEDARSVCFCSSLAALVLLVHCAQELGTVSMYQDEGSASSIPSCAF